MMLAAFLKVRMITQGLELFNRATQTLFVLFCFLGWLILVFVLFLFFLCVFVFLCLRVCFPITIFSFLIISLV